MANRRSEMAMRAALLNPNSTTAEIRTTLQEADGRQRASSMQASLAHAMSEPPYAVNAGLAFAGPEHSLYMSQTTYSSDRPFASTHLHAIDESTELTNSAIAQEDEARPGKMRKNIMSGFRRVAKAVKTAAKADGARKHSVSGSRYGEGTVGGESISHPHMLETGGAVKYEVYPGEPHRLGSGKKGEAYTQPRQRSQTQEQLRAPPFVAGRAPQQARVRSLHYGGGLPRVHTSSSLASMDRVSSTSSLASCSPRASDAGLRRMSPLGQSPQMSVTSDNNAFASCEFPAPTTAFVSCEFPRSSGSMAKTAYASCEFPRPSPAPPPNTARSADAIPAQHSTSQHNIYPTRRDRSATLPGNQQTAPVLPMRVRRKASEPHCGNPELGRLAQNIASVAPRTLDLPISRSPLLAPSTTQDSVGKSAGARIQRQAVRNLSAEYESKLSDDLLMLPLLPSPADTASNRAGSPGSSQELPLLNQLPDVGFSQSPDAHYHPDRPRHYLDSVRGDRIPTSAGSGGASLMSANGNCGNGSRPEFKHANDSGVQVNNARPSASSEMLSQPSSIMEPSGSPPSPFSFGHHSRYSLINHDGSLNLTSYQFEQLDGYQKRLSGSPPPIATQPSRSEGGKIADRIMRKAMEPPAGGWPWSGSSQGVQPRRLMRKPRKQANNNSSGEKLARAETQPLLSVNLWTVAGGDGAPSSFDGEHDRSLSISTTHSAIHARVSDSGSSSVASRRASQHGAGLVRPPAFRRSSDNPSLASMQRASSSGRWPRLMHMAPESVVAFDTVYGSSIAALSMEQALTMVEGTARNSSSTHNYQQHQQQHGRRRRMHKRSTSALSAFELDDIMIRTAEMCHSVQTAIKMQNASGSGLGEWIASVVGKPQHEPPAVSPEPLLTSDQVVPETQGPPLNEPPHEFFSADCSPEVPQGPFVSPESSVVVQSSPSQSHISLQLWTADNADKNSEPRDADDVSKAQDTDDASDACKVADASDGSYVDEGRSDAEVNNNMHDLDERRVPPAVINYSSSLCSTDSSSQDSFVVQDPVAIAPANSPRNPAQRHGI